jgi:hypothetical protein
VLNSIRRHIGTHSCFSLPLTFSLLSCKGKAYVPYATKTYINLIDSNAHYDNYYYPP